MSDLNFVSLSRLIRILQAELAVGGDAAVVLQIHRDGEYRNSDMDLAVWRHPRCNELLLLTADEVTSERGGEIYG